MFSKAKNKSLKDNDISSELVEIGDTPERTKPTKTQTRPASRATTSRMSGGNRKPTARPSGVPSLISGDVMIKGTIEAAGEVQFDGALEGDIRAKGLVIGESATVKGEIVADKVKVAGNVEGAIRASQVELSSSANVKGDIMHSALSIETGARFDGNCRYSDDPTTEQARTKPITPKAAPRSTNSEAPVESEVTSTTEAEEISNELKTSLAEAAPAATEEGAESEKPVLKSIPNTGGSFLNRSGGKSDLR